MPIYTVQEGIELKINHTNNVFNIKRLQNQESAKAKKVDPVPKEKKADKVSGDVFEKSKPEDTGHVYSKSTIEQLKVESQKSFDQLKNMINNMLQKQGTSFNLSSSDQMITIDPATRAEASEMIGENGPYGVEAMSDSIVDFAKAISGGDKSKLDTLKKAIDKGFKEAERALGKLPEISMKTYDRIMEKLDVWENE